MNSRSPLFAQLVRSVRLALASERSGASAIEVVERANAADAARDALSRRRFLGVAGGAAAVSAAGCAVDAVGTSVQGIQWSGRDVGIVGAGIAGLSCAYELQGRGLGATVYEASDRTGGRMYSMGGAFPGPVTFPGQVIERGGELIDTAHTTIRRYITEFNLPTEDLRHSAGEVFYFFNGVHHPESAVVADFRAFVSAMRNDLRAISAAPSADAYTASDAAFDRMSLREYLDSRPVSPLLKAVIDDAYTIEYGQPTEQISSLSFLLYMGANRRSAFQPFGSSDERFHIVGGNQQVPAAITARLSRPVQLGKSLVRVRKTAAGRIELTFQSGASTTTVVHDAVVLTIPFSVLRGVELDPSLALPTWKSRAIRDFRYGTNAKMMVGFNGRPWAAQGSNGVAYSDLANLQNSWETAYSTATASSAVLTNYTGAALGARLDPANTQVEVGRFLADLDRVYPGALAAAARDTRGNYRAHIEAWPRNPLTQGSYTCNQPGYFTTICGNEAKPVGNLFFAGEHTSSFFESQGFMEGGAESGVRAAGEVIAAVRANA